MGNTSSDSKTESGPLEVPSEDRSTPLAITPFFDDLYMQIRRAYYATSEESSDSSTSSTIQPPHAPVCPRRKARLLQPYEPKPFMQPFRYHPNGMTFIHTARKRIEYGIEGLVDGRVIIQRDFDRLETELQEAHTQIAGFQKEQIKHDNEIVLTRVRISTLKILIEDIQVRHRSDMKSLLDTIYKLKNHKGGPLSY
ncbi:hypothetical protein Tco_0022822 [Tanacetum coccineum]